MRDVTAGNRCFLYEHSFLDTVSGDDRNLENLNIAQHKEKEKGGSSQDPVLKRVRSPNSQLDAGITQEELLASRNIATGKFVMELDEKDRAELDHDAPSFILGLTGRIWLPKEVLVITRNTFNRP